MPKLTIWHGGVKISPVTVKTEEEVATESESKFNTCIYRGENEETRVVRTCCTSKSITGYACNKLGTFPLKPEVCEACQFYVKKEQAGV